MITLSVALYMFWYGDLCSSFPIYAVSPDEYKLSRPNTPWIEQLRCPMNAEERPWVPHIDCS